MKLKSLIFVLIISFFRFNKSLKFNTEIVVDFLDKFNLNIGILFYCDASIEELRTLMTQSDFKYFAFYNISSNDFNSESSSLMNFESRQLGVIVDGSCSEARKVFDECSRANYFNASYNWLVMSEDFQSSINIFEKQNINLDAELTLAVVGENEREEIKLFDVYNPNSRTNGELVVQLKGSWTPKNRMQIILNGSKFDRRSNLNGAVVMTGVAVTKVPNGMTLEAYLESKRTLFRSSKNF